MCVPDKLVWVYDHGLVILRTGVQFRVNSVKTCIFLFKAGVASICVPERGSVVCNRSS